MLHNIASACIQIALTSRRPTRSEAGGPRCSCSSSSLALRALLYAGGKHSAGAPGSWTPGKDAAELELRTIPHGALDACYDHRRFQRDALREARLAHNAGAVGWRWNLAVAAGWTLVEVESGGGRNRWVAMWWRTRWVNAMAAIGEWPCGGRGG